MLEEFLIKSALEIIVFIVLGVGAVAVARHKLKELRDDLDDHIVAFGDYKKESEQSTQNAIAEIRKDIHKIQSDQSNLRADQRVIINEQKNWREFSGQSLQRIEDAVSALSAKRESSDR